LSSRTRINKILFSSLKNANYRKMLFRRPLEGSLVGLRKCHRLYERQIAITKEFLLTFRQESYN
jgi:hypothetical protein